jgi:NitT/TauT family transport system substrate-binding protein
VTNVATIWSKTLPALVAAAAVLATAGGAAARTESARALTPVTIAVLPIEATAQGFYAKDEGFFRRQGIDATIKVIVDPQQIVASLLSGDARFSSASVGALAIVRTRGLPLHVVAGGSLYRPSAPTTAVVAAPGRRYANAHALAGKLIAIDTRNNLAHIALLEWLKRNGLAESDVRLTEIPFAEMLGPLERGQVDAAVIPEPYLTLVKARGATRIADPLAAVCARDCVSTMWIARNDVDRDLASRFRNAIQAASVWANKTKNQPASAAILARYSGLDAALVRRAARTAFSTRLRPALAQPWIDAFAEFGVIPSSFSALDLVK